jgi:hypothetical protein
MRKCIIVMCTLIFSFSLFAQDEQIETVQKLKKSDRVVFDYFNDFWQGAPSNASVKQYSPGVSYSSFQDYPLGTSNFTLAYGLGFSFHNMRTGSLLGYDSAGVSVFTELNNIQQGIKYKVNKHTFTYLDTPVELRFRSKGKNTFRVNLGFRFSVLLQEHSKYVGDDFRDNTDHTIKFKEYKHRNFETYRYGVTARIGYKWFNVFGYYSLTNIFKDKKGPEMYPISLGISFIPL